MRNLIHSHAKFRQIRTRGSGSNGPETALVHKLSHNKNFLCVSFEKELRSLEETKYGIFICCSDHPLLAFLKDNKLNIGYIILDMYFNNDPNLCLNVFYNKKICDCSKIHIINNGIISVIEKYKNFK